MSSPSLCSCLVASKQVLLGPSGWHPLLLLPTCPLSFVSYQTAAEGVLDLTLSVLDKGIKMYRSQELSSSSHSD